MKRLVFAFTMIVSFLIFNGLVAQASYTAPDGNSYEYRLVSNNYNGWYAYYYSNDKFAFCTQYMTNGNYYGIGLYREGSVTSCGQVDSRAYEFDGYVNGGYPVGSNAGLTSNIKIFYQNQNSYVTSNSSFEFNVANNPDIPIYDTLEECYDYITMPDVDYDNVIYNPLIPTPKIQVLMLPYLTTALEEDTQYTFVQMLADDYPDYYVQVMAKYTVPDSIRIGSKNGQFTYDVISYAEPQTQSIYALNELTQCQDINIGTQEDFWGWLPTVQPEVHYSVPAWENNPNNSIAQQATDRWNDYLRNYMPLYGNQMEIYARLYLVNDGQIYCGAWRHWQSSAPTSFTEEIPDTYQPGYQLPGYENTDNNTEVYEGNTITDVGTPTGQNPSTTVVVNQNVPNYPDYPTAVSYNHDNILVQMITTAKNLPSFFTEFTSFLVVSFAFIPAEIWSIIGFGFLASIVIMIIKVL